MLIRPMALSCTYPTMALPFTLNFWEIRRVRFWQAMRSAMKNSPKMLVSTSD